jgi:putative tryptophan/tyrosine transport system substrate-binding protein
MERRESRWSRRQFVAGASAAGLGLLAGCGRLPGQSEAPTKIPHIGFLQLGSPESRFQEVGFRQGLQDLGYVEGQNIAIESRYTENVEELTALAAELVHLKVDLLVVGGVAVTQAAKQATSTIPIVMASSNDPIAGGLVPSLAHPGGNVTGLTNLTAQLAGKWLQLLQQTIPAIHQVAFLLNPSNPTAAGVWDDVQAAGRVLEVQVQAVEASAPEELETALAVASAGGAEGLLVMRDTLLNAHRRQIADLVARHRLPAMSGLREAVAEGLLMAYGPNLQAMYRRAAVYVDKILKGANPADLPVEQPMTFDFVVNMKTAQALGITFPNEIMLQVTEIIQ